jgi:cytochrome c-type biogenesis protein CcmH/NrfG
MAAAWRLVGDGERAKKLKEAGFQRDCTKPPTPQSKDNCQAWYQALVHLQLDDARTRIDRALKEDPQRAEFLDTLAMVLEAQGHLAAARDAAVAAARLAPDDVYLLLQAARLSKAAGRP